MRFVLALAGSSPTAENIVYLLFGLPEHRLLKTAAPSQKQGW